MTFSRPPELAWTDGARITILDLARPDSAAAVLEEPAATIWLEAPGRTMAELVGVVADAFEQPPAAIRGDVDAFVSDLVAAGLLVSDRPAG